MFFNVPSLSRFPDVADGTLFGSRRLHEFPPDEWSERTGA